MTIIEDIKERLDLVEWVGKRVELKRAGRRWVGLCPFHTEKTGSFFVFEDSQRWKCFGCGKSGDLLDFAQAVEGWTLPETIQELARFAGVELRPLTEAERHVQQMKRDRQAVFGIVAEFLQIAEVDEKAGVAVRERARDGYEYARGRGFDDRTIATARLGWFGKDWGALREALLDAKIDLDCPAAVAWLGYSGDVASWRREWRVQVDKKWVDAGRIPAAPPEMLVYVHFRRGTVDYLSGRRVVNEKGPKGWNPPVDLAGERMPLFNATWREAQRCVVVEGQACAWTLEQWGFGAAANLGAEINPSETNPLLGELLKKEELFIAFDADDAGRRGTDTLVERLLKGGRTAGNVRVVTWPAHDANDWLQAGAVQGHARTLLENAPTWLDVLVGRAQDGADDDATRAVFYALATLDEYGVLRQRDRVCELLNMKKGEFDALLKAVRRELGLNEDGKPKYVVMNGRICHRYMDRYGAESINPLCNFTARIAEDLLLDDGEVQVREFGMAGNIGERTLTQARVEASEFTEMTWVAKAWGSRAIVEAGGHAREHLRAAIQYLSDDVEMKTVFTHTGWREIGGKPVYLSGQGATPPAGGDETVIVELDKGLELYTIPATPVEARDATKTSLEFLDVAPREASWPLWGAMYVAPLREMVNLAFVVWLYAPTGAMKSTLAALAMNHYGEGFDDKHLPAGFIDTANSIERRMFILKDAPLVVDDFAPQKDPTASRDYTKTAHRLVRAAGNLAGRGRLRADAKARQTYSPRCLTLVTGEDLPESEGVMGRLFVVEMQRGEIDIQKLTSLQDRRGRLSHAMSSYLAWLSERWDWIVEQTPEMWRTNRKEAQCIQKHLRLPEAVAGLFLGCDLGLLHARDVGAISDAQYKVMREDAWQALISRAKAMGDRLLQEKPETLFVEVLRTLLTQGKVFLRDRESLKPPLGGPDDGSGGCEMLGWYDQTRVYLIPQASYNRVYRYFHDQGNVFPVREQTLRKQLDEAGLLVSDDGRRTSTLWVNGHTERVLVMDLGKIWEKDEVSQDS
ncbi:MAG: toprim domain-containing protein [Anaerolineae bacterium]|nr:toprim domain-containing protein [Anaerolineae bacterium]